MAPKNVRLRRSRNHSGIPETKIFENPFFFIFYWEFLSVNVFDVFFFCYQAIGELFCDGKNIQRNRNSHLEKFVVGRASDGGIFVVKIHEVVFDCWKPTIFEATDSLLFDPVVETFQIFQLISVTVNVKIRQGRNRAESYCWSRKSVTILEAQKKFFHVLDDLVARVTLNFSFKSIRLFRIN